MEYCLAHAGGNKAELKAWDDKFVRLDPGTLCELASVRSPQPPSYALLPGIGRVPPGNQAARRPHMSGHRTAAQGCAAVRSRLCPSPHSLFVGKSPAEIRRTFNILYDFNPEDDGSIASISFTSSLSQHRPRPYAISCAISYVIPTARKRVMQRTLPAARVCHRSANTSANVCARCRHPLSG